MKIERLAEMKARSEPIVMITAYDHPSAVLAEEAGVDVVLVGDSAANTVLGYGDTTAITVDELLVLTRAVRRGLRNPLLLGDLPAGSYEDSDEQAIATARHFVDDAGCDAVKLEGGGVMAERARAICDTGIPVVGHVGLTPQTATALGGMKAQGRTAERARAVYDDALSLQRAGCSAVVFEAIPAAVTKAMMRHLDVPIIGIGAGPVTDGQVLVWHDLMGLSTGTRPRFVEKFAEVRSEMQRGLAAYVEAVRNRTYPEARHTYKVEREELDRFVAELSE